MLAHSAELIALNDGYGLGAYSEEGLEGCNKILRKDRRSLSRKCGKEENQRDCLSRQWARSDPVSNLHRFMTKPWCKKCEVRGHSTRYCPREKDNLNVDAMFESFFQE